MRFEDQRALLVQELNKAGISDDRVLSAFAKVPREEFVLPQFRDYAYRNQPLPIDQAQTISQPMMIAIMMQFLELKPEDKVLEIGTGSGYQSALLAELVQDVCSVERIESLSLKAQAVLKKLTYKNIYFRIGDGSQGWQMAYPPHKEFEKIIISAATPDVPDRLKEQLAEDGIMVLPMGGGSFQILNRVIRRKDSFEITEHGGCTFVPLIRS